MEDIWLFLVKLKICIPYDIAISVFGIQSRKTLGTSLVNPGLRVCLAVQGMRVQSYSGTIIPHAVEQHSPSPHVAARVWDLQWWIPHTATTIWHAQINIYIYKEKLILENACAGMFIADLCITVINEKSLKCPSVGEWINCNIFME